MDEAILVTYASRFGSTQQVAEAIAQALEEEGCQVDLKPMRETPTVNGYRAVLLGSAVNHGKWLPESVEFVRAHQKALNRVPVALFTVHIANIGEDEKSHKSRLAYLDEVRPLLDPVDEVFFPGRFNRRGAAELIPRWIAWIVPNIDLRKWDVIREWAHEIAGKL